MHDGTFHSFTFPAQLPVARIALFGEKRTCEIGRSSPICEPRFVKLYSYIHAISVLSDTRWSEECTP